MFTCSIESITGWVVLSIDEQLNARSERDEEKERTQQVHWDWVALAERVCEILGEQQTVAHVCVQLLLQLSDLVHEQAVEVRHQSRSPASRSRARLC